jgi:3-(3-hydroxy-phenyl)propionate hydroxylase
MPASKTQKPVIVVGAGPVGMVCALALNRRGVPVTVLEQEAAPAKDQRAATIHPPTLEMLDDLGVTAKILPLGLISTTYRFHDRPTKSVVAEFDLERLRDEVRYPFVLQYEQYKLTASIAAEYGNGGDFDVRFSHTVTGLSQNADGVTVEIATPGGPEQIQAAYVIGCDGGRSTVRKLAGIEFEGFSYPERFIKIATLFDFEQVVPDLCYRNYFSDPDEWASLFKVGGETEDGLWRCLFPIEPDESDEAAQAPERIEALLQKFFPKSGRYDVESVSVYGLHQLVASTFRLGRVLLAGDSAHVNNPLGGIGMNSGMHDGINLAEKLSRVIAGEAGEDLLDLYNRQRRHAAMKYVQAQTIMNKNLLDERNPAVRQKNLDELRRAASDDATARAYMRRAALIDSLKDAESVT